MTTSSEQVAAIHAKIDRGESITKDDRAVLSADLCLSVQKKLRQAMTTERARHDNVVRYSQGDHNAVGKAVDLLILEMFLISAAHSERRQKLEQRVDATHSLVEQEVRHLLQFIEGQARTIDALNLKVGVIEKSLGLAKSKATARRA